MRARTGVSVLAVERVGGATPNPGPEYAIRAGDRLLVLGDQAALGGLERLLRERGA